MPKNNEIEQLVNGSVADANVVNQIVLNAGNEEDAIPYDEDDHQRDALGGHSLGSVAYPWGHMCLNRDGYLFEIETTSNTVANQVAIKDLRKFVYLKDGPGSFSGNASKSVRVKGNESGLEYVSPTNFIELTSGSGNWDVPDGISRVYVKLIGGGAGGAGGTASTRSGGGGGAGAETIGFVPYTVTPGGTVAYSVGTGGNGGAVGTNGVDGGNTTFGTLAVAGGNKGVAADSSGGTGGEEVTGNASGSTVGAPRTSPGGDGGNGVAAGNNAGGGGGSTSMKGATAGSVGNASNATANSGGGGGGGGSYASPGIGGNGGSGVIIISY